MDFPRHNNCTDCNLCESATSPGIPTRVLEAHGHSRALLVVGMAPGYNEDKDGTSWIGWSGQLLQKFINAVKFPNLVDVYLSNAVRCRVPQGQKVSRGDIKTCRPHLLMDIQRLLDNYKEVIILCCGADATHSVTGMKSLAEGFKIQGFKDGCKPLQVLSRTPTLFFTNHPAILYAGRKPQAVAAMQDHFVLLRRYLTGAFIPNKLLVVPELGGEPPSLDKFPGRLSLDVETYGILKGREQTVFTPAKSLYVDGVPYGQQIVTVAVGYRDWFYKPNPGRIRTCVYQFNDPAHRQILYKWIRRVRASGCILQGQNFKFDMLYLIANDPVLEMLLDPRYITLDDSLLMAFLLDEQRPEKSQKDLALLFGIANYRGLRVTGKTGAARSSSDPGLLYYNCLDTGVQIVMNEEIMERILLRYGRDTAKLGGVCAKMRNDTLWSVIGMERAGSRLDVNKLQDVDDEYEEIVEEARLSAEKLGVIAGGEGTRKSMLEFMFKSLEECGLKDDRRVELTDVKKEIAVNKANMNLVLKYLPEGELRKIAETVKTYNGYSHLRNTYTKKLLIKQREGIVCRRFNVGHIYPVWYPAPMVFDKGGRGKEKKGGTIQGRITSRKPPSQTFPDPVKDCLRSRFPGGSLREFDFGQIELRIAALLSGCPVMMAVYNTKGQSIHLNTTYSLYPRLRELPVVEVKSLKEYRSCKALNFLILYRGGADAYQTTARSDCGLEVPIEKCKEHIQTWYKEHPVFKAWQDSLIETVARQGYLELPTGWSRSFGVGKANAAGAVNEICNFPIHTLGSGQIPLSSQFVILTELKRNKMRAVICSNKYDAIIIDTPYDETEKVDEVAGRALTNPPLMSILEEKLGRTIPIEYELKVVA